MEWFSPPSVSSASSKPGIRNRKFAEKLHLPADYFRTYEGEPKVEIKSYLLFWR